MNRQRLVCARPHGCGWSWDILPLPSGKGQIYGGPIFEDENRSAYRSMTFEDILDGYPDCIKHLEVEVTASMPLAANELPNSKDPLFLLCCPKCVSEPIGITKLDEFQTIWLTRALPGPEPRRVRVIWCQHARAVHGLNVSFY